MKKGRVWSIGFWLFAMACFTLATINLQAQTERGGGVPPESLPGSLKKLDIKDYFVSSSFKKAGVIHSLKGHMVVVHKATGEAYFGRKGDTIYENDSVNTLANSRCRIKLLTRDVVTMAPDTEVSVDTFLDQRKEGKKTSLFSMLKGKAKFYALRLLRYRESKFNVKTPTAVVGVRGTEFILNVYEVEKEKVAGGAVLVADNGNDIAAKYLDEKRDWCTDAFVRYGIILFNGVEVGAREMSICGAPPTWMSDEHWDKHNCDVNPDCIRAPAKDFKGGDEEKPPKESPGSPGEQQNPRRIFKDFKMPKPISGGTGH